MVPRRLFSVQERDIVYRVMNPPFLVGEEESMIQKYCNSFSIIYIHESKGEREKKDDEVKNKK